MKKRLWLNCRDGSVSEQDALAEQVGFRAPVCGFLTGCADVTERRQAAMCGSAEPARDRAQTSRYPPGPSPSSGTDTC